MTLKSIISKLREVALRTPNVRSVIINDIYRENAFNDIDYGVVAILQDEHVLGGDVITYGIALVYVDRLASDSANEVDVQSDGMLTLANILNTFANEVDEVTINGDVTFTPYNQRFADDCAGVYAKIDITVGSTLGQCFYNK